MKKTFTILLPLLLLCPSIFAQTVKDSVFNIGLDYNTEDSIPAVRYYFSEKINPYLKGSDSTKKTLFLRAITSYKGAETDGNIAFLLGTVDIYNKLQPFGNFAVYDIETNELKWNTFISYYGESVYYNQYLLIRTKNRKTSGLDISDGQPVFSVACLPRILLREQEFMIGYKQSPFKNIVKVDFEGNTQWKRKLNGEYGWNSYGILGDTSVIIAADGLHYIDLKDGKGWDYKGVTHMPDRSAQTSSFFTALGLGVASAILTGGAASYYPVTNVKHLTGICSNVLVEEEKLYWACKEKISCLNLSTGEVLWTKPLPKEWTSSSLIFPDDSTLYFINKGRITHPNPQKSKLGIPFIAAFDLETGEQKFLKTVAEPIDHVYPNYYSSELFILTKNRLYNYCLNTGEVIKNMEYEYPDTLQPDYYFTHWEIYLDTEEDRLYKTFSQQYSYSSNLIIKSAGDRILIIARDNLEILATVPLEKIYLPYAETENYTLIGNEEKSILLDIQQRAIAEFDFGLTSVVSGRYVITTKGDHYIKTDLGQIFPPGLEFSEIPIEDELNIMPIN